MDSQQGSTICKTKVLLVIITNSENKTVAHDLYFKAFSKFGEVVRILIFDRQLKWKAFVEMNSVENAQKACLGLNNTELVEGINMSVYSSNLQKIVFQENNPGGVDYAEIKEIMIKKNNESQCSKSNSGNNSTIQDALNNSNSSQSKRESMNETTTSSAHSNTIKGNQSQTNIDLNQKQIMNALQLQQQQQLLLLQQQQQQQQYQQQQNQLDLNYTLKNNPLLFPSNSLQNQVPNFLPQQNNQNQLFSFQNTTNQLGAINNNQTNFLNPLLMNNMNQQTFFPQNQQQMQFPQMQQGNLAQQNYQNLMELQNMNQPLNPFLLQQQQQQQFGSNMTTNDQMQQLLLQQRLLFQQQMSQLGQQQQQQNVNLLQQQQLVNNGQMFQNQQQTSPNLMNPNIQAFLFQQQQLLNLFQNALNNPKQNEINPQAYLQNQMQFQQKDQLNNSLTQQMSELSLQMSQKSNNSGNNSGGTGWNSQSNTMLQQGFTKQSISVSGEQKNKHLLDGIGINMVASDYSEEEEEQQQQQQQKGEDKDFQEIISILEDNSGGEDKQGKKKKIQVNQQLSDQQGDDSFLSHPTMLDANNQISFSNQKINPLNSQSNNEKNIIQSNNQHYQICNFNSGTIQQSLQNNTQQKQRQDKKYFGGAEDNGSLSSSLGQIGQNSGNSSQNGGESLSLSDEVNNSSSGGMPFFLFNQNNNNNSGLCNSTGNASKSNQSSSNNLVQLQQQSSSSNNLSSSGGQKSGQVYGEITPSMNIADYVNPQFIKTLRKSKVIYARWFDKKDVNLQMLFNVFSYFGNIEKMMFMTLKSSCLVEYQKLESASLAKEGLNELNFFKQEMKIFFSNYDQIFIKSSKPHPANACFTISEDETEEYYVSTPNMNRYKGDLNIAYQKLVNPPSECILITGLKREACNIDILSTFFSKVGPILKSKFIIDEALKNICILKLLSKEKALEAVSLFHGEEICGKKVQIGFSKVKLQEPSLSNSNNNI